jgi:hypothetical protein
VDKTIEEHKERGTLVMAPQMGAWVSCGGLCGYDFDPRANAVLVQWAWCPGVQWMGLN